MFLVVYNEDVNIVDDIKKTQNRRGVFRNAKNTTLSLFNLNETKANPFVTHLNNNLEPTACMACSKSCMASCVGSCKGNCKTSCLYECKNTCKTGCIGGCRHSCMGKCEGSCKLSCSGTCRGSCSHGCTRISH